MFKGRTTIPVHASFLLAITLLLSGRIYAQGQLATATLTGIVTDTTGATVPDVTLVLQSKSGGAPYQATTNNAGAYLFSQVRPGSFSLIVRKDGFSEVEIADVKLSVSQNASVDITLSPGSVQQRVEVVASAVEIQSQTSDLSGTVSSLVSTQIPLAVRDATNLVNLVPGVTADFRNTPAGDVQAGAGLIRDTRMNFSINGGQRQQAALVVDGIDVMYAGEFYPQTPVVISPDFTQEMKVHTNTPSAEFGPGSGIVNIITKSGTNQFHGALYEFLQNDKLNANDLIANSRNVPRPVQHRNQYGFALGGPVIKNRFFLFGDWEQFKNRKQASVQTRVPTQAELSGDFRNLYTTNGTPITLYNPLDTFTDTDGLVKRRPFAVNNCLPCSGYQLSDFSKRLLAYYPAPNNPGILDNQGRPTQIGNLFANASSPIDYGRFDVKGDFDLNTTHRFTARVSRNVFAGKPIDLFKNAANLNSPRDYADTGWNGVVSWTWVVSPSLVINNSAMYTRVYETAVQTSKGFDPVTLGGPFADGQIANFARQYNGGTAFPYMQISGYQGMGTGSYGYNYDHWYPTGVYQIGIVKMAARHNIKTGFRFGLHQTYENYMNGYTGAYSWTGGWTNGPNPLTPTANTGNPIADMQLGLIGGGSIQTSTRSALTSKYFAWYVQDDWRVTSKLTLNLGLRYEFELPFTDRYNQIARFDTEYPNPVGTQSGVNTSGGTLNNYFQQLSGKPLTGAPIFPSQPGFNRRVVPTDFTVLQPRIGGAYSITDKLVFRAGFSKLAFQNPSIASLAALSGTGGATATTTINPTVDGIRPSLTLNNVFPNGFNVPTFDSLGALSFLGQSISMPTTRSRTPYQWQWNAGFEFAVMRDGVFSVAYAGSRSQHLICTVFICTDQVPYDQILKFNSQLLQTVPNPFYGIINDRSSLLSQPTIQLNRLLKQFPQFNQWTAVAPNSFQGRSVGADTFYNNWHALQVGFRKSYSAGLTTMVAFTWSKNLTNMDASDAGWLGPATRYQNLVDFTNERSLASEDVPYRLVVGYVYDLPFGKGKRWGSGWNAALNAIAGNWQLSGIATIQGGFPLPISVTGSTSGALAGTLRPNMVSGTNACLDPGRSRGEKISQYLSPAGFSTPPNFTFGNAPRLLNCRADGVKNVDASVTKFLPFREGMGLEIRGEFINAFNRAQLGVPNTVVGGSSFGLITSTYNQPRVIQFGLKFRF